MSKVPQCIECGKAASRVTGVKIYPHRPDLYKKNFWLCECGAYCGCHKGTSNPLGSPCGAETRRARLNAHNIFDQIWRRGEMGRADAYKWLAKSLNISASECHIGMMDFERAKQVIAICIERKKSKVNHA